MIEVTDAMQGAAFRAFWTALGDGAEFEQAMRSAIAAALDAMPSDVSA